MNFLNPSVLFALGAAALPVLIHLLSRRRAKDVSFPSIEFLELIQEGYDNAQLTKKPQFINLIDDKPIYLYISIQQDSSIHKKYIKYLIEKYHDPAEKIYIILGIETSKNKLKWNILIQSIQAMKLLI